MWCCGIFASTRHLLARGAIGSQVLGAEVPSFSNFPYYAREILYLYRHFLQLIYYHYAPEERGDLLFRLRNEFASRRHLRGHRLILSALRRGEGILVLQRQILDSRATRQSGMASRKHGAQSVDALWEQLQIVAQHKLPGLRNYQGSLPVSNGAYTRQSTTNQVFSRRE